MTGSSSLGFFGVNRLSSMPVTLQSGQGTLGLVTSTNPWASETSLCRTLEGKESIPGQKAQGFRMPDQDCRTAITECARARREGYSEP